MVEQRNDGYVLHPSGQLSRGAVLDVGLKCVHSCRFCYWSYLDGSDDQFRGMRRAKFRSLEDCQEILRRLKANGFVNFDITGGEPTLHPDIIEITRYAHQDLGLKGRIITLGQYLMRRMSNCRRDRLIDDLLDTGLVNFLFSMHAVETGLFEKLTGESWAKQKQAMDYLDERGFQYTTNTVVMEWNYRHLPDIAREIIEHRIYLCNFIIMNAYYEWNRDGRAMGIQAQYSAIHPYLREAVDYLESHDVAVNIRYAPLCTMRGMEKNLVGVVGVRYDPYEWMNAGGHQGGGPEQCAARIPVLEGGLEADFQYRDIRQTLDNGLRIIGVRGQNLKLFPEVCATCSARPVCDGVDPNYLQHHGASEFIPYTEPQGTLLHKDRLTYPMPFLVKMEPYANMQAVVKQAFADWRKSRQPRAVLADPALRGDRAGVQADPLLSVIVPTYNRSAVLRKTLQAYAAQTWPAARFEVIVVDDGSRDQTEAVATSPIWPFRVMFIRQEHGGANAARNRGIAAASGDIVLLTGDDMVPAPDFLQGHAEFHRRHPDYQDALLGGIEWFPEIEITPLMRYVVSPEGGQQFSLHLARDGRADFRTFYTCNVSVKRRLLATQNPVFDPAFRYPAYDDVELGYRLQKAGMRLHYRPQVVAYHNHPLTIDDFARKMRQAGCMAVVLAQKHPELETSFLRLNDLLSRLDRYSEDLAASLRSTLAELEKVHVAALATLRLNGRSFDAVYAERVLHPVYGAFFATMYALGVADAVQAVPQRQEVRHERSLPACSIDSATPPSNGGIEPVEDRSRSQPSEGNPEVPIPPQKAIISGPSPAFRGRRLPRKGQPFGINLIGYLSGNLGLGVFARHVLRLLLDRDIPVAAVDLDPGCGRAQADRTYSHLFTKSLDECRYPLTLFALNGESLARVPSHVLEALAAHSLLTALPFWELPVLPPAWLGPLQRLDALAAPSDFVRSALENAIAGIPIVRAHVPIRLPESIAPDRQKFGLPETAFVLLACFEPHSDPVRKNPQGAIEAFRSAWPDDPSVRLVVKVNNAAVGERAHPVMEHLRKEAGRDPRLILLDRPLSYREVLELLASIDVFVSLHRAEGFGLPMFEAMALGKPVVATAWSGNMSFMTYDAACLVGYQWQPVQGSLSVYRPEYLGQNCHWAEPSIPEAVAWLDRLRRDPGLCAAIGERAKARVNDYNAAAQRGQWIEELAAIVAARERGIGRNTAWKLSPATASDATFECSIIIPVCNKAELTANCLTALARHTQRASYEVILVDNGSTDEMPSLLASLGGDVQVIRNAENLGFAKACNQGAKAARGRYLVFLNNDTMPQPGWLDALVREVEEHADVAVVGSKLLYTNDTVQHAGVAISRQDGIPYHLYQGFPADAPAVNRRRDLQCVTAVCMLIRREIFLTVGGFDEGYRNGFEGIDLCLKVRERGHRVVYQPRSVVIYLAEQTPGRKVHDHENMGQFLERWGTRWRLADEDLLAFEDGLCCDHPSPHLVRWRSLASDLERDAWRYVADVQRASQRRDDETVRRLIRQPGRWPADPAVLRWGAAVAKALEETEAAGLFWQRLLLLCEDADARLGLARQAIADGRLDEAQRHLDHLPPHAVNGGEVYLVRGVLAMQRQAFSDAAEAFEAARAHGANQRRAVMGLGMAALGAGQIERSWDAFLAVLKQEPDDAEAVHWLLRAGAALGRWKALAEVLAQFVDRNPGDLTTRFALASVLLRDGRVAEARREEQVLQLLNPQYEGLDELTRALDGHPLCAPSSVSG